MGEQLGSNINKRRKELHITQQGLRDLTGISQGYISDLEKGKAHNPTLDTLGNVAHALKISVMELIKGDIEAEQRFFPQLDYDGSEGTNSIVKLPLLGKISAGLPVESEENIIEYVDIPASQVKNGSFFYLVVTGDSLIGSRIFKGDKVLVKKQPFVENGEIAVVRVNDTEATLKRVKRINGQYILYPDNPAYEPIVIDSKEVEIIGKVVKVEFNP